MTEPRILGFGTYDVRSHPRVRVLIEGMRAHGILIDELNRPLGVGTSGRVAALTSPLAALKFGLTLAARWLSLAWGSRKYRGKARPDALLVGYLGHFDVVLARILFPHTQIILDHLIFAADTAKDRNVGGDFKNRLLTRLDNIALAAADVVVVDTADHQAMIPEKMRPKSVIVPVGAPNAWFAARDETRAPTTPLSVIFFGLFTPLQGASTIARALRLLSEHGVSVNVTFVGAGQDEAECRQILAGELGSVHLTWLDWVAAEQLPSVVANADVCLGIFGETDKARRVVPNKVYQGMAAGCAVITSDTPLQREMLSAAAQYVPAGDAAGLASAIEDFTVAEHVRDVRARAGARADAKFRPEQVVRPLLEKMP